MKFFVPNTGDDSEAERAWAAARAALSERGFPTTRRRIRALSLRREGGELLLKVGVEMAGGHEPVTLILEASNREAYYVCTPSRGTAKGGPYVIGPGEHGVATDFDGEGAGRG